MKVMALFSGSADPSTEELFKKLIEVILESCVDLEIPELRIEYIEAPPALEACRFLTTSDGATSYTTIRYEEGNVLYIGYLSVYGDVYADASANFFTRAVATAMHFAEDIGAKKILTADPATTVGRHFLQSKGFKHERHCYALNVTSS